MTPLGEPAPPHRVALRAAVCGLAAGALHLVVVAAATATILGPGHHEARLWTGLALPSGAALAALFVGMVEVARQAPARARLALLCGLSLLGPLVGFLTAVWVYHLTDGGLERAYDQLADVLRQLARSSDKTLAAGVAVALPFAAAAAARAGGLPGALDRRPSLRAQLGLLLATSAGGFVLAAKTFTSSWNEDRRLCAAGFLLGAPALLLGVVLGERLEAKLLAWHARRLEAS